MLNSSMSDATVQFWQNVKVVQLCSSDGGVLSTAANPRRHVWRSP